MTFFANITFVSPWVLAALIILPALWFLLRITPPAPKKIVFPALRFLKDLIPEQITPSKTPWWILLLRCLIAAFIIVALAGPIINPVNSLPSRNHIRLVIDTGWASAQNWKKQMASAKEIIAKAAREDRKIHIMVTTHDQHDQNLVQHGPLSEGQALSIIRGLKPYPWPANYDDLYSELKKKDDPYSIYSFWIGHGLDENGFTNLARELQSRGGLTYMHPDTAHLPILLRPAKKHSENLAISIDTAEKIENITYTLQAVSAEGAVLDQKNITMSEIKKEDILFNLPAILRNEIAMIQLSTQNSAGSVFLFDTESKKRHVGIVTKGTESESVPLVESGYYLKRALAPYADLTLSTLEIILEKNPAVIILPDIGMIPPTQLEQLENWIKNGGLLLRFAGPIMAQADNFLTPIPLRRGERALEGDLTWGKPLKLSPFPAQSPFADIIFDDDIIVKRQILPEPIANLNEKSWAYLEDGTPLITGANLEDGLIVMIHTTATPEWSDLPLSGLYIQLLKRIMSLSSNRNITSLTQQNLDPILVLNGYGKLVQTKGIQPIAADQFHNIIPNHQAPPGLYGQGSYQKALNLGAQLPNLKFVENVPIGSFIETYNTRHETNLAPYLLVTSFILFLLDWLIMGLMSSSFTLHRKPMTTSIILAFILIAGFSPTGLCQEKNQDIQQASDLYLAYITSGDTAIDQTVKDGLSALGRTLSQRTSVEPAGVIALNPEKDNLAFYPFIYWPISTNSQTLSDTALTKIQYYLDNGGTILFDTRDQRYAINTHDSFLTTQNAQALKRVVQSLNIPPLAPISDDHVLTKSFYLLQNFPGLYTGGTLWVEENSVAGRDGVSSIIIGGHDWASGWAAGERGYQTRLAGGKRQEEMSLRFGINLIMYALTGNYKSDQVHLPFILERLGQ